MKFNNRNLLKHPQRPHRRTLLDIDVDQVRLLTYCYYSEQATLEISSLTSSNHSYLLEFTHQRHGSEHDFMIAFIT